MAVPAQAAETKAVFPIKKKETTEAVSKQFPFIFSFIMQHKNLLSLYKHCLPVHTRFRYFP